MAEKEQALRVLADKIPEGIRDLTVSVLGADEESRKQLEKSISNIQAHVSTLDKKAADQEIGRLRGELDTIDRGIARTTQEMFEARQLETTVLDGDRSAGPDLTPQQAGEWLRENAEDFAYIDDPVAPATPAPLTPVELQELLELLGSIGIGTSVEALQLLPEPADLPTGGELEELFRHRAAGHDSADAVKPAFRNWETFTAADPTEVEAFASDLDEIVSRLEQIERSAYGPVLLHASDPLRTQEWGLYLERLAELRRTAYELRRPLLTHEVSLPDPLDQTVLQRLEEARDSLAAKGKLGLFDRQSKKTLEMFTVDARTPTTVEEVSLCIAAVSLSRVRGQILALWRNHSPGRSDGTLAPNPEDDIAAEISTLSYILEYPILAADLDNRLSNVGYGRVGQPGSAGWAEVSDHLRAANRWHEVARSADRIEEIRTALTAGAASQGASPLHQHLAQDLSAQDFGAWDGHRENVLRLLGARPSARRLLQLRSALALAAPLWAARIVEDPSAARNPLDLETAWEFRQLESWLASLADKPNPGQLQARIEQLSARRRKTITAMVSEMAWRRLADNLGPKERQALQSYIQATKKYGKTGGKFAQRWITEMRRSLDESSSAVPAWIMTTSRALTSFQPERVPPFDVLIIDEASQIGFEALPLLSLSKTAIVVGDDKQTSPENVGLQRQQVFELMDDYLSTVPNYRILFDPDNSLYDLAVQKFATPIMLTEHFRCLPEIIAFSNQHAYNGLITPLRDRPPVPGWAALGLVKVRDGYRQGDINEPEAQQVVELIVELCGNPAYQGMTFGVVSLLGSSQSKLIWDQLYDRLGPEEMETRQIRCGEAANFQGDERDVIVITTVVAVDPSLLGKRIGAMTGNRDLRRINVATSRAKNQMWVVTSVEPDQLPKGDLRAELIRHCRAAGTTERKNEDLFEACDSEFEVQVVRDLLNRGYKGITVQHKVGKYRLDIVVSGPNGRLAVECDGDRWHGPDVWHRDRERQEVLERAGWTFQRIRGSAYFRDPEAAMQPVWDRLDALGIPTGDEWMTDPQGPIVREVFAEHVNAETGPMADFALWANEISSPGSAGPADGNQQLAPVQDGTEVSETVIPEEKSVRAFPAGHVPEDVRIIGADIPSAVDTQTADTPSFSETDQDPDEDEEYAPADASAEDEVPEVETAGGSIRVQGLVQLSPYEKWNPRPLPAAGTTNKASIQLGLIDIVGAEGPMIARQAYLRYVQASGGQRVGSETKRVFNQVVSRALSSGKLKRIDDGVSGVVNATLYTPSQPQVSLRELGPRTIFDVPLSELRTLMDQLTIAGIAQKKLPREVLNTYGLRKLTQKTLNYILETQENFWKI